MDVAECSALPDWRFAGRYRRSAQKIKIIVDQDARGPGTSDQQAILVFLQSDKFDVLGITTVSGDQWVKEETQHVLRMLEIADRTDVPVYPGRRISPAQFQGRDRALGSSVRQVRIQGMLDGTLRSQPLHHLRRALPRPRHRSSHEGRRAAHSGRSRHCGRIHREDGPQVSGRSGSVGRRPADQFCAGAEARSHQSPRSPKSSS